MDASTGVDALTSLQGIFGWLGLKGAAAASGVMLLLAIAHACLRTQSTHLLFVRLWSFLHGRAKPTADVISSFIEERNSLMRFRFVTGIGCSTARQAEKLINWVRDEDVDIPTARLVMGSAPKPLKSRYRYGSTGPYPQASNSCRISGFLRRPRHQA